MIAVALTLLSMIGPAADDRGANAVDPFEFERARAAVVRAAVAKVSPSIVTIETIGGAQPIQEGGQRGPVEAGFRLAEGPTTGLVLTRDGLIVTSSFNFAREPSIITVTLHDGKHYVARLLGRDHIRRLAVLSIDADDLPAPEWAPPEEIHVGQYAISCGIALGGDQPMISLGIVSALDRRNGNAVQTDAKVSPVNYGGPLVDIDGRVLGVLVPMAGSGGALAGAEWYDSGIGFAIYKSKIDLVFDRLAAGETIEQGKIGVVLEEDEPSLLPMLDKFLPQSKGVKIREVARHSPASRAKLRAGDKITAIDGQSTGDLPELQRRLSDRAAGETISLSVKRRWKSMDVKLTLIRAADIGKKLATGESDDEDDKPAEPEAPTSQPDEGN